MSVETSSILGEAHAFLEALKIRGFSPATIKSRHSSLSVFFAWLAGMGIADLREVNRQTVRNYQLWLLSRGHADTTVQVHLQALRRFFEHLEAADIVLVSPCDGIFLPKLVRRLPKVVLNHSQAMALLNTPDTQTKMGIRDKAILEMFYSTGIRLNEMARLTIQDADCAGGFLRVTNGKGGKDRIVPLGSQACQYVRIYMQKVRLDWTKVTRDEHALWLTSRHPHGALKSQAIEAMVTQYGHESGLNVTPHVWRHTCATHLVADGANIAYVQQLLGHRSLRTTQIYTRTTIGEIKTTHSNSHPRS